MGSKKSAAPRNTVDPKDADFLIERDNKRKLTYYTPQSHRAYDFALHHNQDGSTTGHLAGVPMHGRSFMFQKDNPRAYKLAGFLQKEGFTVATV